MARSPLAALVVLKAFCAATPAMATSFFKRTPAEESPSSPGNRTQASLSLGAGTSLLGSIRSAMPSMGGEFTLGATDAIDAGGFYDRLGPLSVYGAVARLHSGHGRGPFVDAKVGVAAESSALGDRLGVSFGTGVGYKIRLGELASVSPRAGLRYSPGLGAAGPLDLGVMFSFRI